MRLYRSDAGCQEREKDIRADAVIVSMSSTKLSRGMVASLQPAALSPGKIIVPRSVIGGVILDQPATFASVCEVTASRNLKVASFRTILPSHSTTAMSPIL